MKLLICCLCVFGIACLVAGVATRPSGPAGSDAISAQSGTLQVTPTYFFIDRVSESSGVFQTFTLTNRGDQPISVLGLDTGCNACSVATADPTGRVLKPGDSCDTVILFQPPEIGVQRRQVRITHSGPTSPAVVSVDVVGRRQPPYLLGTTTARVSFFDLSPETAAQTYKVTTFEHRADERWLEELTCDMPDVSIELVKVSDEPAGSFVTRTYEFKIGWRRMPEVPEFHGQMRATTQTGSLDIAGLQGVKKSPSLR